jgi:glucosylceramidase
MKLESVNREKVLASLFDPESGCRFTICRMPIAANDYALDWYSFAKKENDFTMEHFSIDRDRKYLIPYIKSAQNYNPGLKIWASPWCPPEWMKTNHHYACRMDEVNDLCCEEKEGREGITQFIMEEKYLHAYALYFSRFIKAYNDEGIHIYAVHPQNEPNSCQNFPSCIWKASDLGLFIGKYLGPQLEHNGLDAEIWYGTIERPYIENIDTVLEDPVAGKYIKGIGFQWAGKGAIGPTHRKYPDMKLMQTESECGDGANNWNAAQHTFGLLKHYLKNGANSYMYWNMVLDETGKSRWGWKQNSLISVDKSSLEITYHPEYYLMKLFSTTIDAGAYMIDIENKNNILAFLNPGNTITIMAENSTDTIITQKIQVKNNIVEATLKPQSISAILFKI